MIKSIILLMVCTGLFSVDIGETLIEKYDWLGYVRSGESTKDQLDRSKEALDKLDGRYAQIHDSILVRLSEENKKLFVDSEKK
jgi:hypothetical protein